ncbi:hypothetical protein [Pedobacter frigoris]|uniref:hypothetical protein n=1 Tax=Pedobacter frigoris TaxID=2571272 RepID=UPI0029312C69|nr:hypothetical protein [Pedobacter frigoris]
MKRSILLLFFAFVSFNCFAQTPDSLTLRKLIIKESKEGGKLDFFTRIKGKETVGSQIKPGVYAQNIHIAWYYWGKANYVSGIKTLEEVLSIFKEWKEREPGRMEVEHIRLGYADGDNKKK